MNMKKRRRKKMIHKGSYVAEVEVELIDTDQGWSPCLSLEDSKKLDEVREALRKKNLETAFRFARVYPLTPLVPNSSESHVTTMLYSARNPS